MGTRAQVAVHFTHPGGTVYIYQHYDGGDMAETVAKSLVRIKEAGRIDDEPYFTRMLFCDIVQGYERESTGFGISPFYCDSNVDVIHLYPVDGKVEFYDPNDRKLIDTLTFEEFIMQFNKKEN